MARTKPKIWVPVFEGTFYNTARAMAIKHVWRVRPMLDVEDLVQEAALVFYRCADKYYPEQCSTPKHFMGLFVMSLSNRITSLASDRFKYREQCAMSQFGEDACESIAKREAESDPFASADLSLIIEDAPHNLRDLLYEIQMLGKLNTLRMYNDRDRYQQRQKRKELQRWATKHLNAR